jgi:hypothetical protein
MVAASGGAVCLYHVDDDKSWRHGERGLGDGCGVIELCGMEVLYGAMAASTTCMPWAYGALP